MKLNHIQEAFIDYVKYYYTMQKEKQKVVALFRQHKKYINSFKPEPIDYEGLAAFVKGYTTGYTVRSKQIDRAFDEHERILYQLDEDDIQELFEFMESDAND